jgi:small subunit ribosomal protein S16
MTVKLRLTRMGAKKRPYYRIVAADVRAPRDGDFIEKIGTYNPLINEEQKSKVELKKERVEYWLSVGAQPTDKVAKFIAAAGIALPASIVRKMTVRKQAEKVKPSKKELKEAGK